MVRKAATKVLFSGGGGLKAGILRKKNRKKMWPISLRGGDKALVAVPLKKELFCGFPKNNNIFQYTKISEHGPAQ